MRQIGIWSLEWWCVVGSFEVDSREVRQIGVWSMEWYVVGSFEEDSRRVR